MPNILMTNPRTIKAIGMQIEWQEPSPQSSISSIHCFFYRPLIEAPTEAEHCTFSDGSETERLLAWHAWFMARDPDLVMGHNVHANVVEMVERCAHLGVASVTDIGREPDGQSRVTELLCKTDAMGQWRQLLWRCPGRVVLDTYLWADQHMKLRRYSLEAVMSSLGVDDLASLCHQVLGRTDAMRIACTVDSAEWCRLALALPAGLGFELPLVTLLRRHLRVAAHDDDDGEADRLIAQYIAQCDKPSPESRWRFLTLLPVILPHLLEPMCARQLSWKLPGHDDSFLHYDAAARSLTGRFSAWSERAKKLRALELEATARVDQEVARRARL
jgi:hypothetical protein